MDEETKAAMDSEKPVMIFHIGSVGQMNPSATTVNNTYYGDQFVPEDVKQNAQKPQRFAAKVSKPERKSTLPKTTPQPADGKARELMTFSKRGILNEHLKLLFNQMMADGWIPKESRVDDFLDLFSGECSECTIIWAGKYGKGTLVYFFRHIELEGLITVPKGFTIPNILMGHFVDNEGNFLTHLDKGDAPNEKCGKEVESYIKILKTNAARAGRRPTRQEYDDDDYDSYGDSLNPYELNEEGLSTRNKRGF